ncbi:MAG: AAA family ATPase [Kocuria sp.]|nr:AAA family ATPase [Kocuria sp.]
MSDQPSIPGPWVDVQEEEKKTSTAAQAQPEQPEGSAHAPRERRRETRRSAPRDTSRTSQMLESISESDGDLVRPEKGVRRFVYDMTNGRVNPGLSKEARLRRSLVRTLSEPLPTGRVFHVGCLSQKGGVGKTTNATALGATTATYRNDKILGLDVNPDGGSMALRVPQTSDYTILDLRDELRRRDLSPMEFDSFVNQNPKTRFDAIVMPPGQKPDNPLTADDYRMVAEVLQEKYPYRIVFVDCGTDLTSSVMDGVLPRLDLLVTITTNVRDEAAVTMGGLDALADDGYEDLVANSVTMMVHKQLDDPDVQEQRKVDRDIREIRTWFRETTRSLIDVPYDSAIRRGGVIDLSTISKDTELAYLRGAAEITTALDELG